MKSCFSNSVFTYSIIICVLIYLKTFIFPNVISYLCDWCAYTLLTCVIAWNLLPIAKRFLHNQTVPSANKSVLITGCDTGFGHDLAKRLDSKGFQVFASCLFPGGDGANILRSTCSNSLHIVALDVTKEDSVKDAFDYVQNNLKQSKLWAVVNNAGVARLLAAELASMKDYEIQMDVNAFGVVRVTKAFLPLIRRNKGRIITVTSMVGRVSSPYNAGYSMSKFAATAFCEILRQELYHWDVKVVTVEPEMFKTPISDEDAFSQYLNDSLKLIDTDVKKDYGDKYFEQFRVAMKELLKTASSKHYKVIDCLEEAVSHENPSYVYKPRRNYIYYFICLMTELLPKPIVDAVFRLTYYYQLHFPKPQRQK